MSYEIKITEVKEKTSELIEQLLKVWENSVKATHLFLSSKEIENIKEYVPQAILQIPHLVIIENNKGIPIAFMGTKDQKIEMLFVNDKERNKGLGKQLVSYGIINYNIKEVTVNEQDNDAKGFYEHIGFKVYKKEELDEQGNHYPILYMKLTTK